MAQFLKRKLLPVDLRRADRNTYNSVVGMLYPRIALSERNAPHQETMEKLKFRVTSERNPRLSAGS